jgi:SAF domain
MSGSTAPPTASANGAVGSGWAPHPPDPSGLGRPVGGPPVRAGRSDRLPRVRRPRRPGLLALGLLLVVGSAAVTGSLLARSGSTVAVLALARPVAAGQRLAAADLAVARLGGSGLHAVRDTDRGRVLGMTAVASLPAGTLLTGPMVTARPVPGPGEAVVGLALKAGALPAAEVAAGRHVSVLRLPAPAGAAADPAGSVLAPSALVVSVRTDPATGAVLVSLVVLADRALPVSAAGAAGLAALAVLPEPAGATP